MTAVPAGPWRKASRSQNTTDCVEIAPDHAGGTLVRDSKNPAGAILAFERNDWTAFLTAATR